MEPGSDLVVWGWMLLLSSMLALGIYIYQLFWRERYRHPSHLEQTMRVRGQLCGAPGTVVYCVGEQGQVISQRFELVDARGKHWIVDPGGAVLAIRGYRHRGGWVRGVLAGERVTVDGVPTSFHKADVLYRESGRISGIEAIRIAGGHWPELRWLRVVRVVGVLVFLFSLTRVLLATAPVAPDVEPTEAQIQFVRCSAQEGNVVLPQLGRLLGNSLGPLPVLEDRLIYEP